MQRIDDKLKTLTRKQAEYRTFYRTTGWSLQNSVPGEKNTEDTLLTERDQENNDHA